MLLHEDADSGLTAAWLVPPACGVVFLLALGSPRCICAFRGDNAWAWHGAHRPPATGVLRSCCRALSQMRLLVCKNISPRVSLAPSSYRPAVTAHVQAIPHGSILRCLSHSCTLRQTTILLVAIARVHRLGYQPHLGPTHPPSVPARVARRPCCRRFLCNLKLYIWAVTTVF